MPEDTVITEAQPEKTKIDLQHYTCERCGFVYTKVFDYPPFLCYKCLRFVAKRTVSTVRQITPQGYTHVETGEI